MSCIIVIDQIIKHKLVADADKAIYYNNVLTKNCCDYIMDRVIDEESIAVLGSSELSASDKVAFPPFLFNRGSANYNMVLIGGANFQSLAQAINVGALQNNIKNNKVVLIVSPQWFKRSGISDVDFSSRFEEANYVEFIRNSNISEETKKAVCNRVNNLLAADPIELGRVKKYQDVYMNRKANPLTCLEMSTYSAFKNAKTRFELAKELKQIEPLDYNKYTKIEEVDFNELLVLAEKKGIKECTTNGFGVYDEYYNTYIKDSLEEKKNSNVNESFATSKEYDDLKLFLDVCEDTGIDPLIVNVPVNGRWYDYTGFDKADRNTYYQNVRNICQDYNVELADFSEREYEKYFLKDIMHMGWKGWVYLDEAVYSFYKGERIQDRISYDEMMADNVTLSEGVSRTSNKTYEIDDHIKDENSSLISVVLCENGTILDECSEGGQRSSVYLHTGDSGEYTVRIGTSATSQESFVDIHVPLEKGSVYKIAYFVDEQNPNQISLRDVSFSRVIY